MPKSISGLQMSQPRPSRHWCRIDQRSEVHKPAVAQGLAVPLVAAVEQAVVVVDKAQGVPGTPARDPVIDSARDGVQLKQSPPERK